jgi:hypothetical protein
MITHYAFHGSPADYGAMGGAFFVVVAVVSTNAYWRLGAALDCFILSCSWWLFW